MAQNGIRIFLSRQGQHFTERTRVTIRPRDASNPSQLTKAMAKWGSVHQVKDVDRGGHQQEEGQEVEVDEGGRPGPP